MGICDITLGQQSHKQALILVYIIFERMINPMSRVVAKIFGKELEEILLTDIQIGSQEGLELLFCVNGKNFTLQLKACVPRLSDIVSS